MRSTLTPALLRRAEAHLSAHDPRLKQLIAEIGPCTLHPARDKLFEVLIRAIISQQLSNKAADTIQKRLLARVSPTPEALLELEPQAFREAGLSGNKARYIQGLARAAKAGEFSLERLDPLDDEQAIRALSTHAGVGRWTAEMVLIFGLGRPDVLALADLGLQNGIRILHGLETRPDKQVFSDLAQPWRPYRSVACWYLWRVTDPSEGPWG